MKNAGQLRTEIFYRLAKEGITIGPKGTLYEIRYLSQKPEDRKALSWTDLLDELVLRSVQYGLDAVLESAFIQQRLPQQEEEAHTKG